MSQKTFFLVAGGTGGHLFPALSLGYELMQRGHDVRILTDKRSGHYRKNIQFHTYVLASSTPFAGHWIKRLLSPFVLLWGVIQSLVLIIRDKPSMIVGFGGYTSLCPLIIGRLLNKSIAIHEQNAILGRANRLLAFLGAKIAVSYEMTHHIPDKFIHDLVVTGNPVRMSILDVADKPYQSITDTGVFTILVFGGSQGASIFSQTLPQAIALLSQEKRQYLHIIQQCRKADIKETFHAYSHLDVCVELREFFEDMPEKMATSQLIISRSGASTISELSVIGRPAILVPLASSLDQDQALNALQLTDKKAAWLIDQHDFTSEKIYDFLNYLMDRPEILEKVASKAQSCGQLNATKRLTDFIENNTHSRIVA